MIVKPTSRRLKDNTSVFLYDTVTQQVILAVENDDSPYFAGEDRLAVCVKSGQTKATKVFSLPDGKLLAVSPIDKSLLHSGLIKRSSFY